MRQFNLSKIHILKAVLFIGAALVFYSCEGNSNTKGLGKINRNFANRVIYNATVIYKDSGQIALELKTPLIEEYSFIDSPYTVMKKGLQLKFWSKGNPKPNHLRADWAKINDLKKTYEGRGNVVMINNDGDTLKTNHIFWDRYARLISTKDTVTIARINGTKIISNQGLEGSEDFKEFTFYQNHGLINAAEQKKKSNSTITQPQGTLNQKTTLPETEKKPIPLPLKEKVSQ